MLSLKLGPLALPVGPLLWLAVLWTTHAFAVWLARRDDPDRSRGAAAGGAVWRSALIGLAASRLAFVAASPAAYLAAPLLILDLRDGGWSPAIGAAAALAALARFAWRSPALRRPLAAGAAAGALLWGSASALLGQNERVELPNLALATLAGAPTQLADAVRGKPAVINLWATWCPPCLAEMPLLAEAAQRSPGVRFIFVNQGEPAATVERWLGEQRFALPAVLLDTGMQLGPAIGSGGLPTTLFVDAQGGIVVRHMGILSSASLAARLRELGDQ